MTKPRVRRSRSTWTPIAGQFAVYVGRTSTLFRNARARTALLEIVGEASTTRTLVKAIGRAGKPIQFTVLTRNIAPPTKQLF